MEYSPNPRVISFDLGVPSGRKRSFASQVFARGKCNWNLEECINRLWSRDPCLIVPVVASRVTILQESMDHEYFVRFCTFLFNRFVLSKYNINLVLTELFTTICLRFSDDRLVDSKSLPWWGLVRAPHQISVLLRSTGLPLECLSISFFLIHVATTVVSADQGGVTRW